MVTYSWVAIIANVVLRMTCRRVIQMQEDKKPIIVVFEGVDKSGKTSVRDRFNSITDFKYIVIDRLTTSSKVYNKIFGRDRYKYYDEIERRIKDAFNVIIVICKCDDRIIKQRLKNAKEELPTKLKNIGKVSDEFEEEVRKSFDNFIIVNTSVASIDVCANEVKKFVESFEV